MDNRTIRVIARNDCDQYRYEVPEDEPLFEVLCRYPDICIRPLGWINKAADVVHVNGVSLEMSEILHDTRPVSDFAKEGKCLIIYCWDRTGGA